MESGLSEPGLESLPPEGLALPVLDPASGKFTGGAPELLALVPVASSDQPFVSGSHPSGVGDLPRVTSQLTRADRLGGLRVRWNIGRMRYRVEPGLYALDRPGPDSPVLVSANYKLSFDRLRSALSGRSAWILVLDTDGVNVWCAAGKGTFGTAELVQRIQACRLAEVVDHQRLILPQLSAPGVAAHRVAKATGFAAHFGPVRAEDLAVFLDSGQASAGMRRVRFGFWDRLVLVPVELTGALRRAIPVGLALLLLAGLGWPGGYFANLLPHGLLALGGLGAALVFGALIHPLALPFLPGRSFSAKGLQLGIVAALGLGALGWPAPFAWAGLAELVGLGLMIVAATAFLAMNFTGCSTFTSLSGVRREMRWAVPVVIGLAGAGLLAWLGSRLLAWGG